MIYCLKVLITLSVVLWSIHGSPPAPGESTANANANANSNTNTNDNAAPEEQIFTVIAGQVVDELGQGIEQADISISKIDDSSIRGTITSNQFGDFEHKFPGRHSGRYKISFSKSGYTSREVEFEVFEDDFEAFVDLTLSGALTLVGEVVEFLEGQPVVGAKVTFKAIYRTVSEVTDEAGRFEITNLIPGPAEIIIEAEGFGNTHQNVMIGPSEDLIRIELKPERILKLLVLDDQDQPVSGVAVEMDVEPVSDYRVLTTDQQGQITIRQLAYDARQVWLRLTHRDYVSTGQYDRQVELPEGQYETKHTLTLTPAAILKGQVTDAESGATLQGARLDVGERLGFGVPHSFTNLSGQFELTGISPGSNVVTVHVTGYAPQLVKVNAPAKQVTTLNFALQRGRTVTGIVRDVDGQPIEGANLEAIKWRSYETLGLYTRSNKSGKVVLENAPEDEFLVDIVAPAHGALYDRTISADKHTYEFVLDPAAVAPTGGFASLTSAEAGDAYPDIKLTTLAGQLIEPAQLKGKVVLLDFWATWCGPCVQEIPTIKRIHEKYGKRDDFVLLSISSDYEKTKLESFIRANDMNWPQVWGEGSGAQRLNRVFQINAIPCTILFGPDAKVDAVGLVGEELEKRLDSLLKAE